MRLYFRDLAFVLAIFLMLLAWLVPNHYYPWLSAYNEFLAFAAAILLLWTVFLCGTAGAVSAPVYFCLVISLVPLAQYVGGVVWFFGDAFLSFSYLFMFGVVVYGGRVAVRELWRYESVLFFVSLVFVLGAMVSVFVAIWQWFQLPVSIWMVELRPGYRPSANLAQPNHLATLLCLGILGVFYLYESRRLGGVLGVILIFLLVVGVVLTRSRAPWIAGLCVVIWWFINRRKSLLRVSPYVVLGWLAFYWFLVFLFPKVSPLFVLDASNVSDYAYNGQRLELWWQILVSVLKGPIWGYGWGQVGVAQLTVSPEIPVHLRVEYSHSILLDLLVWNGPILGGAIILVSIAWLLRFAISCRCRESVFTLMMVGVILVHGLLEYPLAYSYFLLPLGWLLGMEAGRQIDAFEMVVPRVLRLLVLLVVSVVFFLAWFEYRAAEEENRAMRFQIKNFSRVSTDGADHHVVFFDQLKAFVHFARLDPLVRVDDGELKWAGRVAWRFPYASSLYRYSVMLAVNGRECEARMQLLLIRQLYGDEMYEEALESMHASRSDSVRGISGGGLGNGCIDGAGGRI